MWHGAANQRVYQIWGTLITINLHVTSASRAPLSERLGHRAETRGRPRCSNTDVAIILADKSSIVQGQAFVEAGTDAPYEISLIKARFRFMDANDKFHSDANGDAWLGRNIGGRVEMSCVLFLLCWSFWVHEFYSRRPRGNWVSYFCNHFNSEHHWAPESYIISDVTNLFKSDRRA
jgi:hypothetical protein